MSEDTIKAIFVLCAIISPFIILFVETRIMVGTFGTKDDGNAHLTFEDFRSYYCIAPERWHVEPERLYYKPADGSERIVVTFLRVRDVFRYRKFAEKHRDQRLRELSDLSKLAIMKGMSEDAGKLQASALKDVEEAAKRYIEIVRRCKEDIRG